MGRMNRLAKSLVLCVFTLLFVAWSGAAFSGTSYYLDSAAGSDGNPGTKEKPWKCKRCGRDLPRIMVLGTGDTVYGECDCGRGFGSGGRMAHVDNGGGDIFGPSVTSWERFYEERMSRRQRSFR